MISRFPRVFAPPTGFAAAALCAALLPLAAASSAQAQYRDYPQIAGKVQPRYAPALPPGVAIDFEVRDRSEGQTMMINTPGDGNGYELTRARGGIAIQPAPWISSYVQFQDAHVLLLSRGDIASNMRDTFDFRQAYLAVGGGPVKLSAGREELKFGGERLVGISDWTNVSRTFDGIFGRVGGEKNHVDLFSSSVVVIHPTGLDMHAAGLNFHGAYGTVATWIPRSQVEPYVFVKALRGIKSQQSIVGDEIETTFGVRALGNAVAGLDYTVEGALQRGSYSNDAIHAGAGYAKVGYTARLPWHPRLQGEYDYATGNPHRNPSRIGTFDQLYPSAHNVFGLTDLFGWENIKQTRINMDLNPARHLTVLLQGNFLHVANVYDSVYSGSGSAFIKPAGHFANDHIGDGVDASLKYVFRDCYVVNLGGGHLFPGELMTANKHGAPATIAYLGLTYRFKLTDRRTN